MAVVNSAVDDRLLQFGDVGLNKSTHTSPSVETSLNPKVGLLTRTDLRILCIAHVTGGNRRPLRALLERGQCQGFAPACRLLTGAQEAETPEMQGNMMSPQELQEAKALLPLVSFPEITERNKRDVPKNCQEQIRHNETSLLMEIHTHIVATIFSYDCMLHRGSARVMSLQNMHTLTLPF